MFQVERRKDFRITRIEWNEKSSNYKERYDENLPLPVSDIYNAFSEEGRKLYWKQAREGSQQYGIDAWWCDSSEPITPEWSRAQKPLPEKMYEEFPEQSQKMMPADMFYDALIAANQLRYQLLPYIYSCAGKVWEEDATIMRLLAFDFADDKEALLMDDQYLFGSSLMVCPVTFPMYYGKNSKVLEGVSKTREIYLPAGSDWYDFWTDEQYEGGQHISVCADLSKIPLFVKAGSIIPMTERKIECTQELSEVGIHLHIYPGKDAVYELYEDAGEGYGYEQGEFSKRKIEWKEKERKLEIQPIENCDWTAAVTKTIFHERAED